MRTFWIIQVALNLKKSVVLRDTQKKKKKRSREDRDWNEAATGLQASTGLLKARKHSPLELSKEVQPGQHLDFGLLPSRTVKNEFLLF